MTFLATPAKPLRFTPGWTRKLVKSKCADGRHLDREEARATLKDEPYAKLLKYVGGSRDGIWFEYDPRRVTR